MTPSAPGWLRRLYAALRRRGAATTITTVITTTVPAGAAPGPPAAGGVARDPIEIAERRIAGLDWHIAAIEADRAVTARQ